MIKTETRELGTRGYVYSVKQLGARDGGRMLLRLAKLLGGPVGEAVTDGVSLDSKTTGAVISGLAAALSEEEFDRVCTTFGKCSSVTGGNIEQSKTLQYGQGSVTLSDVTIFDVHFAGEYVELMAWIAFAFEVNFGSFLAVAAAAKDDLISDLQASAAPPTDRAPESQSRNTSEGNGRSGESQALHVSPPA